MPRFTTIQQRFTRGELDPRMIGRDDIDQYYGALATAQNIITLPQGGFKRCPGLEHIDRVLGIITLVDGAEITETAPNGGTAANGSDQNSGTSVTTTANVSTTNPYVVLHYDLGAALDIGVIYLNAAALTVSGTNSEFYLQVSLDNAAWTTVGTAIELSTTAKDFTRRVHSSYRYVRFARIGSTDLGTNKVTLTGMDIATESGTSNTRCISFEFNVDQTYKMVASDKNIAIYQGTTYLVDIYVDDLTSARLPAIDWTADADTLIVFHEDVETISLQRAGANDVWTLGTVSYSNIPQFDFGSGAEDIWSSTRGWPRRGKFYQGRLWVDGGRSLPSRLYGSKVNDVFNFDFGTSLDDEAVGPLTDSFNDIEAIYPGRNLMIFTTGEEYIIPQTFGDPITPTNAALSRQTSIGSEPNFRPQEVEGGVMYIQRQGASVQEFIFDEGQQAFQNAFVSLLSSHLVEDPVDFTLRKATSTEEGAYLLLVQGDGTLTIANILRSQGITSFVQRTTDGEFKSCGADVSDMYFVVEREIDGETINWLERFNNAHFLDASTRFTTGLPTDTFTGLDHLEGETCFVRADESNLETEEVSGGSVTIDRDAEESMEIGLNFTVTVKDLPASIAIGLESTLTGRRLNLSEVSLRLYETSGIMVNGKTVSFRGFGPSAGGSPLDAAPTQFTGVKRLLGFRGWNEDAQVTITQTQPNPMTVLQIKKRINS